MDQQNYAELVVIAAAAASLYAANSKTIVPLRVAAIAANALAMAYSFMHGTYPTFVLNAVLLPLNAWRLHGMLKLIHDIDAATRSDMNVDWLLPYMRPRNFKAGDIMMKRGEYATGAYYITAGEVELVELDGHDHPGKHDEVGRRDERESSRLVTADVAGERIERVLDAHRLS